MKHNWLLDEKLKDEFLQACIEAASTKRFDLFKSHPAVNCIIENSTQEWADKIRQGTGILYEGLTPNEVRYEYTWLILTTLIHYGDYKKICEIGGGYGGMCAAGFNHQFLPQPIRYYLYDIDEVILLASSFLRGELTDHAYERILYYNKITKAPPHDICIAWCSWSELNTEAKISYIENVMHQADHIFVASNWDYTGDLELLKKYFSNVKEYNNPYLGNIIYT